MDEARWVRYAGIAGITFVLLIVVSAIIPGAPPAPDAPAAAWRTFYTGHRSAELLAVALQALATAIFVLFASGLRAVLQRAEGGVGVLAWAAFAGGILTAAASLVGLVLTAALALYPQQEDTVIRVLVTMANLAVPMTYFPWAGMIAAASMVLIVTKLYSRWLGFTGLLVALHMLLTASELGATSGPMMAGDVDDLLSLVLGMVWLLVFSAFMTRSGLRPAAAAG